jgi:hypothetical protein
MRISKFDNRRSLFAIAKRIGTLIANAATLEIRRGRADIDGALKRVFDSL